MNPDGAERHIGGHQPFLAAFSEHPSLVKADFWQWERATSSGLHQSSELNEKELSSDVGMSAGGRDMTQISAGVFVLQDAEDSPHSSGCGPDLLAALQMDTETGTDL